MCIEDILLIFKETITQVYPWEDVVQAHKEMEANKNSGKASHKCNILIFFFSHFLCFVYLPDCVHHWQYLNFPNDTGRLATLQCFVMIRQPHMPNSMFSFSLIHTWATVSLRCLVLMGFVHTSVSVLNAQIDSMLPQEIHLDWSHVLDFDMAFSVMVAGHFPLHDTHDCEVLVCVASVLTAPCVHY